MQDLNNKISLWIKMTMIQVRSIRYLEDERWEIYHKHSGLNEVNRK